MFKRIRDLWHKLLELFSHDHCYSVMEASGIAVFGKCKGLFGGDAESGYLQYDCMDCPYFVDAVD